MSKKADQGTHDEPKKKAKAVESAPTKQLIEEAVVSETLQQQAERRQAIEAEKKAEENKKQVIDSTEVASHTKASFKALIEVYKRENPIKYEMKKAALERKLASL